MMKNVSPEEESIIRNIRNLFRLENIRKGVEDKILGEIKNLFEEYHKPVRFNNFWNNNYIEYKSNSDKNRALSVEKYLEKITRSKKTITPFTRHRK